MDILKRVLIILSLVFFFSCSNENNDNESRRAKAQEAQKELKEKVAKENEKEDRKSDYLIYNIGGVIYQKDYDGYNFYFYIKLDNDKLVKWETTDIKYHYKDVGDKVHFEFLRKDRYSDKAID